MRAILGLVLAFVAVAAQGQAGSPPEKTPSGQASASQPQIKKGARAQTRRSTNRPGRPAQAFESDVSAEDKERAWTLVERAHNLASELPDRERAGVLVNILARDSRVIPDAKRIEWATELSALAADLPEGQRTAAETAVTFAIADVDWQRGLQALEAMAAKIDTGQPSSGVGFAAVNVFQKAIVAEQQAAVPRLRDLAARMGEKGAYPFMAMFTVARWVRSSDEEVAGAILADATRAYVAATSSAARDSEFTAFITIAREDLPKDLLGDALARLVRNLLAREGTLRIEGEVKTTSGTALRLKTPSDLTLTRLLPTLKEVRPTLYDEVLQKRPQLGTVDLGARVEMVRPSELAPARRSREQAQRVGGSVRQALESPAEAMALLRALPSAGERVEAFTRMASIQAERDPKKATEFLAEARKAAEKAGDKEAQLDAAAALAEAARVLGDRELMREQLQIGFKLAGEVYREQADAEKENPSAGRTAMLHMARLVSTGIKDDPDAVLAAVEAISDPYLRASMLVHASRALAGDRPGNGFRQQPRPARPAPGGAR